MAASALLRQLTVLKGLIVIRNHQALVRAVLQKISIPSKTKI